MLLSTSVIIFGVLKIIFLISKIENMSILVKNRCFPHFQPPDHYFFTSYRLITALRGSHELIFSLNPPTSRYHTGSKTLKFSYLIYQRLMFSQPYNLLIMRDSYELLYKCRRTRCYQLIRTLSLKV